MTLKRSNRTRSKITRKQLKGGSSGSSGSSRRRRSRRRRSSSISSQGSDPYVRQAINQAMANALAEAIQAPTENPDVILLRLRNIYQDLVAQDENHVSMEIMQEECSDNRAEVLRLKNYIMTHGTLPQRNELRQILRDLEELCPPGSIFPRTNREERLRRERDLF